MAKKSITECEPLPKEIIKWGMCLLLHKKHPEWDGTYRYDDLYKKDVPNIKWVCKECDVEEER